MYFLYVERLGTYFQAFENFYLTGRSSLFRDVHLRDLLRSRLLHRAFRRDKLPADRVE